MDWLSLRSRYAVPTGVPARGARLLALGKVLAGTQYDVLPNPFSRERSGAGEYIPLSHRRPAVRTNLCRTVVDEAVSLLFGDTHWPSVMASSDQTVDALAAFVRATRLGSLMMDAAVRGSVGSVAILFEVVESVPKLSVLDTAYMTPRWDPLSGELIEVAERFVVTGRALAGDGHVIPDDMLGAQYWWQRIWTRDECRVMAPLPVSDRIEGSVLDATRTIFHGLGFVPVVWIRNLSSEQTSDPDGECTFERAIDTVIEADYLLSQAGRGLKYGSDPTLVLKTGGRAPEGPARQGGASSALTLPPEGDAKLLEINGNAAGAVLAHYKELRELVLEQLHGNRAHADRLAAAQSGRAMEMMCQPLIWLADRLRHAYGEGGLVPLFRMACRFSCVLQTGLLLDGDRFHDLSGQGISLHWPPWFAVTNTELLSLAQGLTTAVAGGVLSRETAVRIYANATGNPDPAGEWRRLSAWISEGVPATAEGVA